MLKIRTLIYVIINTYILKLFGLKLSRNIGDDYVDAVKRLLSDYEVRHIVDGGACRGGFSLEIAAAFPFATVYAFEPQKQSYNLLANATRNVSRIKTYNHALSSYSGISVLHTNVFPQSSSLSITSKDGLYYFQGYTQPEGIEEVEVTSLSDFLSDVNVPSVDILKLDVQGHELQVLDGMAGLISSVKLIFIEVPFIEIYQSTPLFSDVEIYLRAKGFVFYQFFGLVRSPIDGRLLYGDAIFINRKYISLS